MLPFGAVVGSSTSGGCRLKEDKLPDFPVQPCE